jgi:hypothetical protein
MKQQKRALGLQKYHLKLKEISQVT